MTSINQEILDYANAEVERLRALRDELVSALDVLLRYVDEEAEDGMMQCVETQMARDALHKAKGEKPGQERGMTSHARRKGN